jgi:hypothetical protein
MSNKIDTDGGNPNVPPDIPPAGSNGAKDPAAKKCQIISGADGEYIVMPDGTVVKIKDKAGTVVEVIHTPDGDYEVIETGGSTFSVVKIKDNPKPKSTDSGGPGSVPNPPSPVPGGPSGA